MYEQSKRHPRVMIADESEDTRELLRIWLEAEGYSVTEARNGEEAVTLTRGNCPDVLLMATRLPDLDGLEATRRIRETAEQCAFPIICMSTYPTKEARASAFAAGCTSFIAKPLDLEALDRLVSRLCSKGTPEQQPANRHRVNCMGLG